MKKQFFFYASVVLALFASCSKDEPIDYTLIDDEPVSSTIISPKEAAEIANKLYDDFFEPKSRSSVHKTATAKNVSVFSSTSSRGTSDTTLYVVNFPEEGGYAIVAAPRNCESNLLAIVPEGSLDPAEEIENPGLKMFVDDAITYSTLSIGTDIGVTPLPRLDEMVIIDTIAYVDIKPRTNLKWGQGAPLSDYCDNDMTGCAPLAISMIMSYYETPTDLYINFKNIDKPSICRDIELDWNEVKRYKTNLSMGSNSEVSYYMAMTIRQIGEYARSTYKKDGTGTTRSNERKALQHFLAGRSVSDFKDFDPWDAVSAVQDGFAFMVAEVENEDSGHAWIAEGSQNLVTHEYHYFKRATESNWTLQERIDKDHKYLYYNWGWNGKDNGYFFLWNMTTSNYKFKNAKFIAIK